MSEYERPELGDDSVKGEVAEDEPDLPAVDEDDLDREDGEDALEDHVDHVHASFEVLTDQSPGSPEAAGEWFTPADDDL